MAYKNAIATHTSQSIRSHVWMNVCVCAYEIRGSYTIQFHIRLNLGFLIMKEIMGSNLYNDTGYWVQHVALHDVVVACVGGCFAASGDNR
jgi:hypothetical protein